MAIFVNDNGTLRQISFLAVNDNGTLRGINQVFVNDGGSLEGPFNVVHTTTRNTEKTIKKNTNSKVPKLISCCLLRDRTTQLTISP